MVYESRCADCPQYVYLGGDGGWCHSGRTPGTCPICATHSSVKNVGSVLEPLKQLHCPKCGGCIHTKAGVGITKSGKKYQRITCKECSTVWHSYPISPQKFPILDVEQPKPIHEKTRFDELELV